MASSHKDQKIGLFTAEDMESAVTMYRGSRLPGGGPKLSIRAVAAQFAHKHITFGSLQKRLSGEVQSMGPSSGGKGRPRVLPRDVEGNVIGKKPDLCDLTFRNSPIRFCVFLCYQTHRSGFLFRFPYTDNTADPVYFTV